MRTFRRRLFASVCVLSLILCLATVGLWGRSYWYRDSLHHVSKTRTEFAQQAFLSDVGGLNVDLQRFPGAHPEIVGRRSFWLTSTTAASNDDRYENALLPEDGPPLDYFHNRSVALPHAEG